METVEKIWYGILIFTILFFSWIAFHYITADKVIRGYYLAETRGGALAIGVDIDNMMDNFIQLNGSTLQEVVAAIDSLNKGLYEYNIHK